METEIQYWVSAKENDEIFSSKYWNDEEAEVKKEWYILNGNTHKLLSYLKEKTTLFEEYESIIQFAEKKNFQVQGSGIDIAAGVCWVAALISRTPKVEKIIALEISKHRLLKIAPKVFDLFNADGDKIVRVLGSFYDIKMPDQSVNFCFMSQAFHHAKDPERLLAEIRRVLKPHGFILIIGESPIYFNDLLKKVIKNYLKIMSMPFIGRHLKDKQVFTLIPTFKALYAPDNASGDHYYRYHSYFRKFSENGFNLYPNKQSKFRTFIAEKE